MSVKRVSIVRRSIGAQRGGAPPVAPSPGARLVRRPDARRERIELGLALTYVLWAILLFDLHYFAAFKIVPKLGLLANLAFVPVLGLSLFKAMTGRTARWWVWYVPFALLVVAAFGSAPVQVNRWMGWLGTQVMLSYYTLALATALFVRRPKDALPILGMMAMRFLWWAFWGRLHGAVSWDPNTANPDDFGALMVQGGAICFWFGMATRSRWQRWLMFALALYSVVGVVTSLARGAFLALVAIGALIWLRSPRKALTGGGIVLGALVVILAATARVDSGVQASRGYRSGTFKEQIMSVFSEGTESGTGAHRVALWGAAIEVWKQHPVFGVGPNNFGVFAAQHFKPGEIEGYDNVGMLWGLNVHSAYFQVLSEFGLLGTIAFFWLMIDFVLTNRKLRSKDAVERWKSMGMDEKLELRSLSCALEGGFVAVVLNNAIYSTFMQPWFIALLAVNRMLWYLTCYTEKPAARRVAPRRAMASS